VKDAIEIFERLGHCQTRLQWNRYDCTDTFLRAIEHPRNCANTTLTAHVNNIHQRLPFSPTLPTLLDIPTNVTKP
jgi:hypothetical protein